MFYQSVPGYESVSTALALPRVTEALERRDLALTPRAGSWGSLLVRFENTPRDLPPLERGGFGRPSLVLSGKDGTRGMISFEDFSRPQSFRLPRGRYEARFTALNGMFRYPAGRESLTCTVGAEEAEVAIDWAGTGAISFGVEGPDGEPFRGLALTRLVALDPPGIRNLELAGPPFVVVGVESGDYTVEVVLGGTFPAPGESDYLARVTVEAGRVTRTRLVHRSRR